MTDWRSGLHPKFIDVVNEPLSRFVGARVTAGGLRPLMDSLFISGRAALADAADLLERFGDQAGLAAATRAESSRDAGNVTRFCHWRQIERVIATLSSGEIHGTVH